MDPRLKIQIWADYFKGELNRPELATKYQISQSSLDQLMTREHWPAKRRALELEMFDSWHFDIQALQTKHAREVVARLIASAEILNAKIMEQLPRSDLNCKDMQNLALAFKAVADIAARAVGVDRMGALGRQKQPEQRASRVDWNLTVTAGDVSSAQLLTEPSETPALAGDEALSP